MTATVRPPQSPIQRAGDRFVRAVLRSPVHRILSGKLLIITVVGRKTGREYSYPVGYAEHDGHLLIGTAARWRRNVRPPAPVRILLCGTEIEADAEIVSEAAGLRELYPVILRRNPIHGRFAGIGLESDGRVNEDDLRRAMAGGVAVVRLRPR
ncbi:nitroreductase/quinone reductase family protein [Nocardia panacis]|nr:nitroreductase/quinone reductase family protein [Nocardia panacis]